MTRRQLFSLIAFWLAFLIGLICISTDFKELNNDQEYICPH